MICCLYLNDFFFNFKLKLITKHFFLIFSDNIQRFASKKIRDSIAIQVSNRITHQLTSRIFAIVLRELLGYKNVKLVDVVYDDDDSETDKIFINLENLTPEEAPSGITQWHEPTLDLEVWMLPDYHVIPTEIESAGSLTYPGRFGWFIPSVLLANNDLPELYPYTMFFKNKTEIIKKFSLDSDIVTELVAYSDPKCIKCNNGMYSPPQCLNLTCAYLLAPSYFDSSFVIDHILELKLFVNVIFLGDNLQDLVRDLLFRLQNDYKYKNQNLKLMIMHWTPSEVIDGLTEYTPIQMPRCELLTSNHGCKYELIPILKYYANVFRNAEFAEFALTKFSFKPNEMKSLLRMFENVRYNYLNDSDIEIKLSKKSNLHLNSMWKKNNNYSGWRKMYNQIACDWLKENNSTYVKWLPAGEKTEDIYIGGIFPMTGFYNGVGISYGASMAREAVNNNKSILPKHMLTVLSSNGKCQADVVMKAFINYYMKQDQVIGVLGPACSETVEPIAGVSKHIRMPVISYSAEGATFSDREIYPYIFRTIGENSQYENIYLELFKQLGWKRVAALTEDGQKYTEYITHMEILMKNHGIELIINKKFSRNRLENIIEKLQDLKTKNAKIIIADIHDDTLAGVVMCQALKLGMTGKQGYVWFLPVWLSTKSLLPFKSNQTSECTEKDFMEALNGHFSLQHAPFGNDSDLMQENITIKEWRQNYSEYCQKKKVNESDYAGFAYDAVWVYAYALNKLIEEDPSYLSNLHSVNTTSRLMELIWSTDFNGVSGRVRFGQSGSRYSVINVLQMINSESHTIGSFFPNISTSNPKHLHGWNMVLNESAIIWVPKDGKPDDGTIICAVEGLANFFSISCDNAVLLLASCCCILFVIALSIASFLFWKRRYDKKLELSAKYMKTLGLDLLSSSKLPENTLDKWEIPKDRVVINRKLGEGAFGTVYGGEAQIHDDNVWTAIAVKTLKPGSTRESQVDFLAEAEIMKRFDHKNIIKLLGVCRLSEPIYTIMEFMLYGDLKTYLLARRHLVNSKANSEDSDYSPKRLSLMALDIARALEYLSDHKYVHRDIACRNCLVNAERVIKLGDFGMARPMCDNDFYKFNRKGMLPVRWMAPESLVLGIFTPASDVWSYGVLLYEVITFGSFPFQGLTNNQVLEHVKAGNTLTIPIGVKPNLEGLMRACWSQDYKTRPTAREICEYIQNHIPLVTPCIDAPLSSVQMAETESDQLNLFSGLRKRSITPQSTPINGLRKSITLNNFDDKHSYNNTNLSYIKMNSLNLPPDISVDNLGNGSSTSAAYNPVEPLLAPRDSEISKSNSSLRRYVPMCGFNKNRASTLERDYDLNTSVL